VPPRSRPRSRLTVPAGAAPGFGAFVAFAALAAKLVGAEWRHHPWRQAAAIVAVGLGVALAFAVHLINASALAEFDQAVHAASGAPDFSVRAREGLLPEDLYPRLALAPGVAHASPVIELPLGLRGADGEVHSAQLLGLDALVAPWISPAWLARPDAPAGGDTAVLDPDRVFLNAAARALIGDAREVALLSEGRWQTFAVAGRVAAEGPPLVIIDIAGAQTHFDRLGRLSRIDIRLAPGARRNDVMATLGAEAAVRAAEPDEAALRMASLSQSYRVNLGVLSLVALFTGGFLVFSVQSLAVAKRIPQLALLGVLGMSGVQRRRLVWVDSLLVGLLGAVLGLALGTALADAALRALGGDLGSGALTSTTPRLHWSPLAAAAYGTLGLASAFAGGWWPARAAERIAPAQSLKGLSSAQIGGWPAGAGIGLMVLAAALALVPPWQSIPWGAYACVAVLLLGGISLVPQAVALLLRGLRGARHPVAALAVARAVDQRHAATAAVAGVVASLSLVVALTVMVTSFRDSLIAWLDDVLPADLYVRPLAEPGTGAAFVPASVIAKAQGLTEVVRIRRERLLPVALSPDQPEAMLIARDLPASGLPPLPWIVVPESPSAGVAAATGPAPLAGAPARGPIAAYASEVLAARQHLKPGDEIALPLVTPQGEALAPARAIVRGIWRDYARQQGALLIARADWVRLTGDERVTGMAVWLAPATAAPAPAPAPTTPTPTPTPTSTTEVAGAGHVAKALAQAAPPAAPVEVATQGEIRSLSLRIFDRSFAVTRWLQGVALAIGLAGIAASFSAQVLARRREFGTLQHLGFTRRQVLGLVAAEGALWSAVGAVLGLALGMAVSVVLVKVVNPQSFHWTMSMSVPAPTLAVLGLGVVVAGALTAWSSGHAAAGRDVVRAVREDW
jgi:putative ABC transport system permease protein